MRLTIVLRKQHIDWHFKQRWKVHKHAKLPPLYKPEFIDQQGIEVVDPNEWYKEKTVHWKPTVPDDPNWMSLPVIEDHPHYHEEPLKSIFHETRLQFGLRQAAILAKTQILTSLPTSVQRLVDEYSVNDEGSVSNDLVRRCFMQAHVWDSTYEKLSKRFNPSLPRWKFKSEWGIPRHKIAKFFNEHLLRTTMCLNRKYPDLLAARRIIREPLLETYIQYRDQTLQIKASPMCLLTSNEPVRPFGNDALLDHSCQHELDDMSPVSPLIDLKKSHLYTLKDSAAYKYNAFLGHPHTLFINNAHENILSNRFDVRKMWTSEHFQARALLFCLASTSQRAKVLYGADVSTLPEPISISCVHHDGVVFNFLFFQLNTLNLSTPNGLKNLAWIDSDNRMVEKIEPKRAMLRNTKYQNYDPMVYNKFRATFLNGLASPGV